MGVLLAVDHTSKFFGGLGANQNLTFDIEEGEIIGLIGPNGSGKTTLINVITGNYTADSGRIRFKGHDIVGLAPYAINRLGIARTYQVVQPFVGMSVQENVATGALFGRTGKKRTMKEAMEKAVEALGLCRMMDKKNQLMENLTIADVKRLEIAKAIATDPYLLLLDEVMAGLNPKEIDDALEIITLINKMGITLLVVEHVMRAVMSVSHRVIVLHQGMLMAIGVPETIVKDEQVIKAYLGEKYATRRKRSGGS
jgi:branched-chain amino acid transport system ATP-binding protein